MYLVQGPPGTGKTTMATEVVRQLLKERRFLRILVTAQSHDPLNHLLRSIDEAYQTLPKSEQPLCIRLLHQSRLNPDKYGEEARYLKKFTPEEQARKLLESGKSWQPSKSQALKGLVVPWRALIDHELSTGPGVKMLNRVRNSANIVYATCNDWHLQEFDTDQFNVAIIEEAGKALASELLVAMRLSRQWLLIGDQNQLPPYRYEDLLEVFKKQTEALKKKDGGAGLKRLRDDFAVSSDSELYRQFEDQLRFFRYLFRKAKDNVTCSMLSKYWRMHPAIGELIARVFYANSKLSPGKDRNQLARDKSHGFKKPAYLAQSPVVWLNVSGSWESKDSNGGYYNEGEIHAIIDLLDQFRDRPKLHEIALLSPYKAQVLALRRTFSATERLRRWEQICHTVDSSQGRQWSTVIVSLVRSQPPKERDPRMWKRGIGFLGKPERLNVMCSRAEKMLILVGDKSHFDTYQSKCQVSKICRLICEGLGKYHEYRE